MRILLTGAAGFIGSHLARLIVTEGHEVLAIVRPATSRWRIADIESQLTIIDADLTAFGGVVGQVRAWHPDISIHLAWKGWSGKAEAEANLSSLGISLELLRSTVGLSCGRFVAAGTCFEYDLTHDRLGEQTPLMPHDLYGVCKKSLFEIGQQFAALTGVSVVTPRIFYSYGPHEDTRRLVPSVIQALLRGEIAPVTAGEQVRDYLHAEDIASALWAVAKSDVIGAVNIASGEPITIAQIALRIGCLLQRPDLIRLGALEYREGEPMHILGDVSALRERLRWTPRFTLESGLRQTIEWWQGQMRCA
jgi:nucleoside-diphosphate-sugar epimerase